MSRCSKCNAAAFELIMPREDAQALVPAHIYDVVRDARLHCCTTGLRIVALWSYPCCVHTNVLMVDLCKQY